jgi:hypothetical protein
MSTKNIYSALRTALNDSGIGIDIAWPNTSYDPTCGTPYCSTFLLPGEPDAAELGTRKTENVLGVFQIDLYFPVERGDGAMLDAVDLLKSTYGRGDSLSYGDSCVRILSAYPSGSPSVYENAWFKQVFNVSWSAYEFLD